ncbi:MAG: hypothetical protein NTV77_01330 [Candidatus Azambacteria bacterium]|nr:hypothetical protein [Candidatus Azambacteria bacterium]
MDKNTKYLIPASIILSTIIVVYAWTNGNQKLVPSGKNNNESSQIANQTIELPIIWGNLGAQMINAGVIDRPQFEALYQSRGGLNDSDKQLLEDLQNGNLKVNQENADLLLNLLWAFGLGNKNPVLENGPMQEKQYGEAGNFASTGGWTLAKGDAMNHYSKHLFVVLTPQQQALVEQVSKNIYRPCCNNSTYFPDCNHGMAMLGLLELLASQGAGENQMYQTALQMNSFWFPDQYATIARHFASKGQTPSAISPKEILGINYSSASGYAKVESSLPREQNQGGGSCGV